MKFTFTAITILAYAGLLAKPTHAGVNSCDEQQPCVKFTRTLIDATTTFPAGTELFAGTQGDATVNGGFACHDDVPGSCYWLICMEVDTASADCTKNGDSLSHTCIKPLDVCSDYEGFAAPLADYSNLPALEDSNIIEQIQCQILPASVEGGTQYYAEFLLKDANGDCTAGTGPYVYENAEFEPDGVTSTGGLEAICAQSPYKPSSYCTPEKGVPNPATDCSCTGAGNVGKECLWKVKAPPNINCLSPGPCNLCPPGQVAAHPTATLLGQTCDHWVKSMAIDDGTCQSLQSDFATTCGCIPPTTPCDICTTGDITYPHTELEADGKTLTCAEWEQANSLGAVTLAQCSALIMADKFDVKCGCKDPVVDCTLCPAGQEIAEASANVEIASKSCSFWVLKAASEGLTSEECASLDDFATACDCQATVPNGGDPHFTRWYHNRESFHGECDLVMVHAEESKFDLHVRTTIDSYFSYIESAAFRVDDVVVEIQKNAFVVNGVKMSYKDALPYSTGPISIVQTVDSTLKQVYEVSVLNSKIEFNFYKQFLSVNLTGSRHDLAGATGLLGDFQTGDMYSREGIKTEGMYSFDQHAFEWQVSPDDVQLFQEARQPQLPFEQCRMPTASRPARRKLRSDDVLLKQAEQACSKVNKNDFQLCVDDVMITGDIGLAEEAW